LSAHAFSTQFFAPLDVDAYLAVVAKDTGREQPKLPRRRAILAALKPKALLVAENLCLRQQLLVLQRRQPRPTSKPSTGSLGYLQADGSAAGAIFASS